MAHRKAFSLQRLWPTERPRLTPGDVWGGLAAMLVAFPAAIAFGVTVYGAVAPSYAAYGALAGIVGVSVMVAKLVDYQFGGLAAASIYNPEELTAFFGFWFSTFNLLSLLLQLCKDV